MTAIFTPTIPPAPGSSPPGSSAETASEKNADKGQGTRRRLLDAAAELFATKGYRNVAVRDICEQACANVAAVNYHFGGKDKLHIAAIDHARQRALQEDLTPVGPKPTGALTAEQKLRRHLHAMLGRAFATGPAGWYLQIVLREMVDPTPAMQHALNDHLGPHQRRLEAIVGQVLSQDPDSDTVKDTASALLATAVYYHACRPAVQHLRSDFEFNADVAERLTNMLMGMVLGAAANA
ncbi:MAG: CerR family C-terminal domain-containing protein [Phycisphaeraceae bacterium]